MPLKVVCDYGPCDKDMKGNDGFSLRSGTVVVEAGGHHVEEGERHGVYCCLKHMAMDAGLVDKHSDEQRSTTEQETQENKENRDNTAEEDDSNRRCSKCGELFANGTGRASHERHCNGDTDGSDSDKSERYECNECGQQFDKKYKQYPSQHDCPEKGVREECSKCGETFTSAVGRSAHERHCDGGNDAESDDADDDVSQEHSSEETASSESDKSSPNSSGQEPSSSPSDDAASTLSTVAPAGNGLPGKPEHDEPDQQPDHDPVPVDDMETDHGTYKCAYCGTRKSREGLMQKHVIGCESAPKEVREPPHPLAALVEMPGVKRYRCMDHDDTFAVTSMAKTHRNKHGCDEWRPVYDTPEGWS